MFRAILLIGLILLMSGGAIAGIIKVPDQYSTIQAAINAAFPSDTVLVTDGTYYENIDFKGKAITVASHFLIDGDTTHINSTIIDGSKPGDPNKGSVVSFVSGEDTTSVLCGFTITSGSGTFFSPTSAQAGGGIFCNNSGCKIIANKIINNSVTGPMAFGGGFAALPLGSNAYVVLKNNEITHNIVTANTLGAAGGGVRIVCNGILANNQISYNSIVNNATDQQCGGCGLSFYCLPGDRRKVIVESNKIKHNSVISNSTASPSALGGGVQIYGCQGRFTKNEVSYNQLSVNSDRNATGAGMQIFELPASFIIEGNIINENAVTQGTGWGGGLNIFTNASPTLINNIIDGNSATNGNGGGILIGGNSMVKLINNSVINNHATSGGGICLGYNNSTNYLMNTIIWGNQAATNPAIHIYTGTIKVAYSDVQGGWTGTGNINLDPQLDAIGLSNSSPCIGKGVASHDFGGGIMCHCPATDIAGNSRPDPAGSNPDIGAWESPLATEVINFIETEIPQSYFLVQNYPNPFNSSTTIEFVLPKSAFVTLIVYNLLGVKVAALVAEQKSAGFHKLNWDARDLASGVYLYRLEAKDPSIDFPNKSGQAGQVFVQARKLILLR